MPSQTPNPARMHDTLLLFGATGDLSQRYLFPSLIHLLRDRLLPPDFRIIAIGRNQYDEHEFRSWLHAQLGSEATAIEDIVAQYQSAR